MTDETQSEKTNSTSKDVTEIQGLGGWLVLVCFGLIVSPIRTVFNLVMENAPFYFSPNFSQIWDPTSEYFSLPTILHISIESLILITFLCFRLFLIYLFFKKRRTFPRYFCLILMAEILFSFCSIAVTSFLYPDIEVFDKETTKALVQLIGASLIWIPYMRVSKRVQNTFVN